MQTTNTILYVVGAIGSVGLLAGGIGYLINQFRTGGTSLSAFYKEQAEGYKVMLTEKENQWQLKDKAWNEKFQEISKEVGQIKGQLLEKEKQAQQYLEILQNRDPEMKKFMEIMISAATNQTTVNTEIVRVLGEIHNMTSLEHERDFKVTATVSKQ